VLCCFLNAALHSKAANELSETFNEIKSATRKAEDFSALRAASCELQQLTAAGDTLEFSKNVIYYVY